jgi:catechol 2,3-dioxygenase-like lactoylglutathione lyase family enzyme
MPASNWEQEDVTVSGLDLLFLEVNGLAESIAFYREQLGFVLESHNADSEPPMATLRGGALRITLVQQLETMLKRGRGVHFVLGVSDVEAYYQKLKDGDLMVAPPKDEGWGGRFIALQDPDGYRLFFVTWEAVR